MKILEELYDCAQNHLGGNNRDWQNFAEEFKKVFAAGVLIYTTNFSSRSGEQQNLEMIASSDRPTWEEYVALKMHELHPYTETELATLEPIRRSDLMGDDQFRQLGTLSDFLISKNIFYMMMVHANLKPHSYVGLYVWRDEDEPDFTDLEKQRIALIMRHLLVLVGDLELAVGKPDTDFTAFGKRNNLTTAEIEILSALIHGHSLRTIAQMTGRAYGTIRWHVQNILEKCHVSTQKELLRDFYKVINK